MKRNHSKKSTIAVLLMVLVIISGLVYVKDFYEKDNIVDNSVKETNIEAEVSADSNAYMNTLQITDNIINNTQASITSEQAESNGAKLGIYASSASKKSGIYLTINDECHWGLYDDICSFLYLAPRACTECISDTAIAIGDLSEDAIEKIDPSEDNVAIDIVDDNISFIRIICTPYIAPEGTNSPDHDDLLLYADGDDMIFAMQDIENPSLWHLYRMADYGFWLEKEIDLFFRITVAL